MQFDVAPHASKQAKSPHELFVINVLVCHLLAIVISLSIRQPLLVIHGESSVTLSRFSRLLGKACLCRNGCSLSSKHNAAPAIC